MSRIAAALLAVALISSPVRAQDTDSDPRLKSVPYQADQVVPLQGRVGFQSMIEFGSGERIENVAVGDSAAWQVTPNKRANLLFVKPLMDGARTNMTVVTNQRVYLFDLSVAATGKTPLYNLRFTYSLAKAKAATASEFAQASAAAPQALNFAWERDGKKKLLPVRAFDDGRSLYLQFPGDEPLPALFAVGPDGNEGPVNFSQSGPYIVVDQVPTTLVMRHGKSTATLTNRRGPAAPVRTAER